MSRSTYDIVRDAILNKQIVIGVYDGYRREMCPHAIGLGPKGNEQALFYQFAGESSSGLGPAGSPKNWRCIPLDNLKIVEVIDGMWQSAPNHSRPQTCVKKIDVEVSF